jgi:hypothetical protein
MRLPAGRDSPAQGDFDETDTMFHRHGAALFNMFTSPPARATAPASDFDTFRHFLFTASAG